MRKRKLMLVFVPEWRGRHRGEWMILTRYRAKVYSLTGPDVWAEPETTAYVCRVGEERATAPLPPNP